MNEYITLAITSPLIFSPLCDLSHFLETGFFSAWCLGSPTFQVQLLMLPLLYMDWQVKGWYPLWQTLNSRKIYKPMGENISASHYALLQLRRDNKTKIKKGQEGLKRSGVHQTSWLLFCHLRATLDVISLYFIFVDKKGEI